MSENKEERPPFLFIVVEMKKPYGVLFRKQPTKDDVMETIADLIISKNKDLDDCFEIHKFEISDDIRGTIAERT